MCSTRSRASLFRAIALATAAALTAVVRAPAEGPSTRPAGAGAVDAPLAERPTPAAIDQAILGLSDEVWRTRESASEQLASWGEAARPALEALVAGDGDFHARKTAEQLLLRLVVPARETGTLVTLRLDDATPAEAFTALAAQIGGASIPCEPPDLLETLDGRVTLDVAGRPYWSAALQLMDAAGVGLRTESDGLKVVAASTANPVFRSPAVIADAPLLVAAGIYHDQSPASGARPAGNEAVVVVYAYPEPGTVATVPIPLLMVDRLDGPSGDPVFGSNAVGDVPVNTSYYAKPYRLDIPLGQSPDGPRDASDMAGEVEISLVTDRDTLDLAEPLSAKDVQWSSGDSSVTVRSVSEHEGVYTVDLVARVPDNSVGVDEFVSKSSRFRLLDAEGRPLVFEGCSIRPATRATYLKLQYGLTASPDPFTSVAGPSAGPPARLIWDVPTRSRPVRVPFRFTELPEIQ